MYGAVTATLRRLGVFQRQRSVAGNGAAGTPLASGGAVVKGARRSARKSLAVGSAGSSLAAESRRSGNSRSSSNPTAAPQGRHVLAARPGVTQSHAGLPAGQSAVVSSRGCVLATATL